MTSVTDTGGYQQDLEDENESIASLVIQKDGSLKVQGTESLLLAADRPFSSLLLTDVFLPYSNRSLGTKDQPWNACLYTARTE